MKFLSNILVKAGLVVEGSTDLFASAAVVDTDKFVVLDGNTVKYRTGTQVLSDIGAQAVLTNPITGTIASGQVAYGTAANTIGGSNNLYFDSATNRLGIGTISPTETLSVVGTGQFSGNVTIVNNANVLTRLNVQNSTIGGLSRAGIYLSSDIGSGNATFGKNSSGGTSYFTTSPTDTYIENSGYGDITLQNAASGGRIKFAGGGSSTSQMTLFSTGNLGIGVGLTDGGQRLQVSGTSLFTGASTFNSTITASSFIRSGGLSTQYLMADGSTSTLTNPVTGTGVSGQVAYWSGTNTQTGSNNLFWDATNNRLGIGTNAPNNPLQIGATPAASLQVPLASIVSTYNSPANTGNSIQNVFIVAGSEPTSRGIFSTIRTRGTISTPTAVLTGDISLALIGGLFDGTNAQGSAAIQFEAESNASAGSAPQLIRFDTGLTGAGRTTKMQLRSNGNLILQNGGTFTDSGQRLQVNGTALFTGSVTGTGNSSTYSVTASSGIARSKSITSTLVAVANNDVLVGLDIAPTFTNGAFTGVSNLGLRVSNANTILQGSGNDASTVALTVLSSGATLLRVRNDQKLLIGGASTTAAPVIYAFTGITGDRSLRIGIQSAGSLTPTPAFNINQENDYTYTTGTGEFTTITANFLPTSGTGTLASLVLRNTINQTGGANGITRGLYVNPTLTAAADWRSIEWSNNTGWGLYGAGTSNNYINGRLGIGSVSLGDVSLRVNLNLSGSTGPSAIYAEGLITSTSTSASYFLTGARTEAASFTLTHLYHYLTSQGVFGAGSTVTNQYGFFVQSSLIGATNNFGFYGNIASGTGRWNFYANGTALNYMNGALLLGSTTDSGQRLQVTGDTLLSGITTITPLALTGSGATSALSITQTWNTSGVPTLIFANVTNTGSNPSSLLMDLQVGGTSQFNVTRGGGINCNGGVFRQAGSTFTRNASATLPVLSINQTGNNSNTSGTINGLLVSLGASPTSGTLVHNHLTIEGAINQTGGANGITRGLYVNPTLTAAADWRSIETSNNSGWSYYGAGTASSYFGGSVGVGTTTMTYRFNVIDSGATYVAGFRGSSSSYIVVGDTSIAGESGVNLRNSSGQTFITQQSSNFIIGTTGSINNITFSPLSTERMRINNAGNLLIGSTTDSGERLQVNGTMKVTGASTFGGNMTLSLNQNANTSFSVSNTTSGTSSMATINLISNGGTQAVIGKYSSTTTPYKTILSNDFYIYNNPSFGDISILNDNASGSIKMAAGASSTAHFTIASTGDATFNSTVTISGGASSGFVYVNSNIDSFVQFQNAATNKWRIGNAYLSGANYLQIYDNASSLERLRWNNTGAATFTGDFTFVSSATNNVAKFQASEPNVIIESTGASNPAHLSFNPSSNFGSVIQTSNTGGFLELKTGGSVRLRLNNNGNVLVGTTTDSGDKFQVNGKSKFSDSIFVTSSVTSVTNGEYAGNFQKTYTPTATVSNTNSYGIVSNTSWNLASASYTGSATYNAASMLFQAAIGGNATTKATQPFRGVLGTLVGISGGVAMNLSDFRFFDIKSPDASGVSGHVVDDMYGIKISAMKGSTNFTITNGWGIYQEGSTDNNYFNGKVLVGTSTAGGSPVRISGLPTSATGLSAGDLWNDAGTIKVA